MKLFTGALAALIAFPGLAHAANLTGTYVIHLTEICQSIENEVFNKTKSGTVTTTTTTINTIDEGKITQTVGFITFKPTKAGGLTGAITASFTQAKGTLAILGMPGPPASPATPDMRIGSATQTGTYSMTAAAGTKLATLNIKFGGDKGSENFTAYFSQLSGATYKRVDFIDTEANSGTAPTCANSGSAQHS